MNKEKIQLILDDQVSEMITSKVVCVGRNYVAHAQELNNPVPKSPLLFMKPYSTLSNFSGSVKIPASLGLIHHELEIAILIGEYLGANSSRDDTKNGVLGVGLALDLTLRDLQNQLKEKGHPWERAKCFPGACPISKFISSKHINSLNNIEIQLLKNNKLQQQGSSKQMIFPIIDLIRYIAETFTLSPGDIVLTGTPAGVGPLSHGDYLEARLAMDQTQLSTQCEICVTNSRP